MSTRNKKQPVATAQQTIPISGQQTADWTIMLYISADSSLANFAVESLKQLRDAADEKVIAVAQLDNGFPNLNRRIPRYVFNQKPKEIVSLNHNIVNFLRPTQDMTAAETLIAFVKWAFEWYPAKHYALILWGHGPELLFQAPAISDADDPGKPAHENNGKRLYLTPIQLRKALEDAGLGKDKENQSDKKKRPLEIIGFDACSMSLVEVAYELKDIAKFMIASQEEVPDLSFPYSELLKLFHQPEKHDKYLSAEEKQGNAKTPLSEDQKLERLCRAAVRDYMLAYEDYICTPGTSMKKVTLSCIRLESMDAIAKGLKMVVEALQRLPKEQERTYKQNGLSHGKKGILHEEQMPLPEEKGLAEILIAARESSSGFVGGLFVDLLTFCEQLLNILELSAKVSFDSFKNLKDACIFVRAAFRGKQEQNRGKEKNDGSKENEKSCIVANRSQDPQGHGLSIYFPYLTRDDYQEMKQPLVKGGDTLGKGFANVLNQAATNARFAIRQQLIEDTEDYHPKLLLSKDTGWYKFIATQWSRILVEKEPDELDLRYSAQQCAINLLSDIRRKEAEEEKK